MYETYWRLDYKPFENTPDPKFLYCSPQHEEALMRLMYVAREHKQGAILTGEYGSGKTVLSRVLLQDLNEDKRFQTVLVVNPKIPKTELLKEILFQMGEQNTASNHEEFTLIRSLEAKLKQNLAKNKKTVFIIDEAQVLEVQELEDLRLLFNFQSQEEFLLSLILIGHGDLRRKVHQIRPLVQRLAIQYHLEPLDLAETQNYVIHRLAIVGGGEETFSPGAMGLIYEGSKGIPRQINNICDLALLVGYSKKANFIGVDIVHDCLRDLGLSMNLSQSKAKSKPVRNGEDKKDGEDSRHSEEGEGVQGAGRKSGSPTQRSKTP